MNDAVAQHRLITSERVLLEQTLVGSVRALSEVLALVHPELFGPSMRQHARVREVAKALRLPEAWQAEVASMLSSVGYVVLPTDVATKVRVGAELALSEQEMARQMPGVVERVLSLIRRLDSVRGVLKWRDSLRASPGPNEQAPLAAQILHAVCDLGLLEEREGDVAAGLRVLRASRSRATLALILR